MKKINIFRVLFLAATVAVSASCITDVDILRGGTKPTPDGKVTFRISVPKSSASATRALSATQEWDIDTDDVWVLMFEKSSSKFAGYFKGTVTGGPTANGTNGGATIDFDVTLPMGGEYNLMVVANAASILQSCSAVLVKDKTQTEIEEALTTSMTANGWGTGHTGGDPVKLFPMWGYATDVDIDDFRADQTSGKYYFREDNPLGLVRMVARVDVKLGTAAASRFVLEEVYVYNYNTKGRLIPDTGAAASANMDWTFTDIAPADRAAYLKTNQIISLPAASVQDGKPGDPANPNAPIVRSVSGNLLERDIYLFEAEESDPPTNSTAYWNSPCLVIGGKFDGASNTTYYRVDFAVKQTDDKWKYIPVKRNNSYTVIVEDVTSPGTVDPDDARKSIPANINAQVVEWSGPSEINILVTDNIYMLGLSHDSFTFMKEAQTTDSEYNKLTVVTDYYAGWSAVVRGSEDPADDTPVDWLFLNTAGNSTVGESTPNRYTTGGTVIDLILSENSGAERTAWIHVSAGKMTYKVRVTQTSTTPFIRVVDTDSGEIIESITYPSTGATARSFRVEWYPGGTPVEVIHTPRDYAELTWDGASGTARRISDDGNGGYTYANIIPNNIGDPMDKFRRYGKTLTFVLPTTSGALMTSLYLNQGTNYGLLTMNLDDIADPPATNHLGELVDPGANATFTVTSTIGGTPEGGTEPEYVGAPWVADFLIDGVWKTVDQITPQDGVWVTLSQYSGNGSVSGEEITYTVAAAADGDDGSMDHREQKGTPSLRWNLSNADGDPQVQNTANCYIIDSPGYYSLPLVYGNGIKNGTDNTAAYRGSNSGGGSYYMRNFPRHDGNNITDAHIYDNFSGGQAFGARLVWEERTGFITDITIDSTGEHLVFNVPGGGSVMGLGCNAIVAVTNSSGVVVWSWHIWATPLDMNSFHTVSGGWQFSKYNLGWVPPTVTSFYPKRMQQVRIRQTDDGGEEKIFTITSNGQSGESTEGYGVYYQFGRKDPFPYDDNIPGFSKTGPVTYGTIGYSIQNPGRHIGVGTEADDWNYNYGYENMWNINFRISSTLIKSVYDPSPVGLMVPPLSAFPTTNSFNFNNGYWFDTSAGPNTAFFPVTNRRTNSYGGLDNWQGGYGGLWSSTGNTYYEDRPIGGTGMYTREWFRQAGALIYNNLVTNADKQYRGRAYGFGIRSIKEQ